MVATSVSTCRHGSARKPRRPCAGCQAAQPLRPGKVLQRSRWSCAPHECDRTQKKCEPGQLGRECGFLTGRPGSHFFTVLSQAAAAGAHHEGRWQSASLPRAYVKCLICRPSPSAAAPKAWDRAALPTKVAGGHRAGGHLDMHRGSGTACDAASRHRLGPTATFYSQCHVQFGETQHGWSLTFAPADAFSPQNTRHIMRALHDSLIF